MSYAVKNFTDMGEHIEVPILCQKSKKSVKSMIYLVFLIKMFYFYVALWVKMSYFFV